MLLNVSRVAKAFGPVPVLDNVSFVINDSDHVGVVGANGVGKSTLLRIIAGEVSPDAGEIVVPDGVVFGYLAQQPPTVAGATVDDLIYEVVGALRQIEKRLREIEAALPDADDLDAMLDEYGELQERFERRGGYELDHQIDIVFAGLGLADLPRERPFTTLSGGEQERVLLATLLLRSPDLLLLDEPTNHLDFAALAWLEEYLAGYPGGIVAVSHDRSFLNRTATRIIEIDERTRTSTEYPGNYANYERERERQQAAWVAEYEAQQDEIHDLRRTIRLAGRQVAHNRPARDPAKTAYDYKGGRVDTAVARNVRSAEERLRRIEADPIAKPPGALRILPAFDVADVRSAEVVSVSGLSHTWDGRIVLDDVSFVVGAGERIALVGQNGSGKSTLLNILAGRLQPTSGDVRIVRGVRLGYLDQDAVLSAGDDTVLDTYRQGLAIHGQEAIDELIRYGLFTIEDIAKPVAVLSAGQRRKLQLARLLADRPTMLLLDEPTNHLGFDILTKLEHALAEYPGPIVAVSHDRWFIERFDGQLWELRDGRVVRHHGTPADALGRLTRSTTASDADVS